MKIVNMRRKYCFFFDKFLLKFLIRSSRFTMKNEIKLDQRIKCIDTTSSFFITWSKKCKIGILSFPGEVTPVFFCKIVAASIFIDCFSYEVKVAEDSSITVYGEETKAEYYENFEK